MKDAISKEFEREEEEEEDAEGWPLKYPLTLSPLSSPTTSPATSPPSSPLTPSPLPEFIHTVGAAARHARPLSRQQRAYYNRRRRERERLQASGERKIRSSQSKNKELNIVKIKFNARKLPVTRQAFIGRRFDVKPQHRTLQSYVNEGFKVIEWDGR